MLTLIVLRVMMMYMHVWIYMEICFDQVVDMNKQKPMIKDLL